MGFLFRKKRKQSKSEKLGKTVDKQKNSKSSRKFSVRKNNAEEPVIIKEEDKNNSAEPITPPPQPPKKKEFIVNVVEAQNDDDEECFEVADVSEKNEVNDTDCADLSRSEETTATTPPATPTATEAAVAAPVTPEPESVQSTGQDGTQTISVEDVDNPTTSEAPIDDEKSAVEGESEPPVVTPSRATSPTPVDDQKALQENEVVDDQDPTIQEEDNKTKEDVAKKLLEVFTCNQEAATYVVDELKNHIVEAGCDTNPCTDVMPMKDTTTQLAKADRQTYNKNFANKILNQLQNEGYTILHHLKSGVGEDWVGRQCTLALLPGKCNASEVTQPQFAWKTTGGGTHPVETRSVGLLDVHNISSSRGVLETRDDQEDDGILGDDDEADEEMNCFFSLTTKDGEVHLFESITEEDCDRLVRGVKNLTAMFTNQLISGDANAITDFYSNLGETDEVRLSSEEAMIKISHLFFD